MKQNLLRSSVAAFALGAALVSTPALVAQEGEEFRFSAGFGYRTDADIDHHGGDFHETRFNLNASRPVNLNDRWRLDPVLGYRFGAYDFSKAEPWDDIHQLRASVMLRRVLNEKWALFGGPSVGFAGESGADVGDVVTFGGAVGVLYHVSERLTLGGGAGVSSQIEDDITWRPLLIINWQIDDRWSIESGYFEAAGSGGLGVELRYQINDQWSAAGGVQYQESRFRLDKNHGPARDGVGEDNSVPVYAKVTWRMNKQVAFEFHGGVTTGGELRLENRRGHKIFREDYDPAPLVGLRALFTF